MLLTKSFLNYKTLIFTLILVLSGCNKFKQPYKKENPFMISTLAALTNGKVQKNFGYYCRLFEFQGKDYTSQLNNTMQGIITEGGRMGANGLIGLSFTTLPINQAINNNQADKNPKQNNLTNINSIIQACGDMVKIDYK